MQMQRDIMHRHRLQAKLAFALHFHTINADVLFAEVVRIQRIARHHAGFIKIETAVTIVQTKQRQNIKQVDLLTINTVFSPRRVGTTLRRNRKFIPTANKLINLFFHRRIGRQA
ncbi:hypothetical protein SDC9_189560 [bioreactor metagenome]|uniref:Uncharacterized protein n=1 Tax=bioreactor metagenome TaxID=1076179 RepID=A0A645I0Q1_9ZZZZ